MRNKKFCNIAHTIHLLTGKLSKVSSSSPFYVEMWALDGGISIARDFHFNRVIF
jgi:hypothetical protein